MCLIILGLGIFGINYYNEIQFTMVCTGITILGIVLLLVTFSPEKIENARTVERYGKRESENV